jgi:hypothetical protein
MGLVVGEDRVPSGSVIRDSIPVSVPQHNWCFFSILDSCSLLYSPTFIHIAKWKRQNQRWNQSLSHIMKEAFFKRTSIKPPNSLTKLKMQPSWFEAHKWPMTVWAPWSHLPNCHSPHEGKILQWEELEHNFWMILCLSTKLHDFH